MTESGFRDPFAYPYLPALSTPNMYCYIKENPLRSFARQPTPSEDAAGHGATQRRQDFASDNVQSSFGVFSHLTPHPPITMKSGEISTISGEERSIQPEESVLPSAAATEQALRDFIKIPPSDPLDLSSLKDVTNPTKIPNLTHLAALAIWASPSKRLTLSEIYDAIESRYPILKDHKEKRWKESLRHRLSLKAVFVRVGSSEKKSRRGGYWALDVSKGLNETKRPRKQGSGAAPTADMIAPGTPNVFLSDRDEQGTSDYSDYSHQSSASISPRSAPPALSVSPMLNYLSYHLAETNISAHHGSPGGESPDAAQAPYSSENLMLSSAEPLGYSSPQASTSYYSASHDTLEYDYHHSPAPPSLNISEHFFPTDAQDADLEHLDVDPNSGVKHNSPEYNAVNDF